MNRFDRLTKLASLAGMLALAACASWLVDPDLAPYLIAVAGTVFVAVATPWYYKVLVHHILW